MNTGLRIPSIFVAVVTMLLVATGLSGCARVTDKLTRWLSTSVDAAAVFDGHLLRGPANFPSEREASLELVSADDSHLACMGSLRYTASQSGMVDFSCSDGRALSLPFRAYTPLSGAGKMTLGNTDFALAYGLTPQNTAAYLALPVERLP